MGRLPPMLPPMLLERSPSWRTLTVLQMGAGALNLALRAHSWLSLPCRLQELWRLDVIIFVNGQSQVAKSESQAGFRHR